MSCFNCPLHQNQELQFIKINNLDKNEAHSLFYCATCLDQFNKLEVAQSNSEQILQKWPPLNDQSVLEELANLINPLNKEKDLKDNLNEFFDSLLIQVQEKIISKRIQLIRQLDQALKEKKEIAMRYYQISKIGELKSILANDQLDLNLKESLLKQLISQAQSEKEQTASTFCQFVENLQIIKRINNQNLKKVEGQILDSFNCFDKNFESDKQTESFIFGDDHQDIQKQVNSSISFDLSLIEFDKILDFSIINIKNESIPVLPLSNSQQNQQQINDSFQTLQLNLDCLDQKIRQANVSLCGENEKMKLSQEQQNKENLVQIKKEQFSLGSCLNNLNQVLNFFIESNLLDEQKDIFTQMQQQDLQKAIFFAVHIQKLKLDDSYEKNLQNSKYFKIFKEIISDKLSNFIDEDQIKNFLIESYPLLKRYFSEKLFNFNYQKQKCEQKNNLLPLTTFKQSTMNQALNPLSIKRFSNDYIQIKATKKQNYTQCYSDILPTNAQLVFRFKIECSQDQNYFCIGLVYDKMVSNNALTCGLDCQLQCIKNNLYVFAGAISNCSEKQNILMNCKESLLEFRVNLSEKLIEVTDFPKYKNKFYLHENFKQQINEKQLRLFIQLKHPSYKIELREYFYLSKC